MASFNWPPGGGGGGGGGLISFGEVSSVSPAMGEQSVDITFGSDLPSTNYRVFISVVNPVDDAEDLLFLSHVITAKSVSGFTVTFNAPFNTANYSIDYAALGDT